MKSLTEIKQLSNMIIVEATEDGGSAFLFRAGKRFASVIWSTGGGWEHVSIAPFKRGHTPTWDEMCSLKEMFFYDNETVVQYHPAKKDYVNNMPNCLHLWKPVNEKLPVPPPIMVGIKKGQSMEEIEAAIKDVVEGK